MKTDAQLLADVHAELSWDPSIDESGILVYVKDGVVTLGGHVKSFANKWAAEKAAASVAGVRAIANEMEVALGKAEERPDQDLAQAAALALRSNVSVPAEDVKAIIENGWITLKGTVAAKYQRDAAEAAVSNLWGVKGVDNNVQIKTIKAVDVKNKIQQAFQRHAALDANKVRIDVKDGTVTLSGIVSSWNERKDAEEAAWRAAGVTRVQNDLSVAP